MGYYLFENNSLSTLASSISDVATSATLATGTGARFPNPTGSDYFMLTFTDAATGLLNEIVKVTARAGDVLTIVRAQEGTTALNWAAGDNANGLITAGFLNATAAAAGNARTRLTADTTFYVRTDGSDSNTGLVNNAGGAWLTLQHAADTIIANYDLAGYSATIQMGDGTYVGATIIGACVGQDSPLIINGNAGTPANVTFSSSIGAQDNAVIQVQNLRFTSSGNGIDAGFYGMIYIGVGVVFHTCAGAQISAQGGNVLIYENYSITGGAQFHYSAIQGGCILIDVTVTITLTGTPAFAAVTARAGTTAKIIFSGGAATFTGAATGQRYSATDLALISGTSGASYIPGNSAGTTGTGGIYN
jgi:hypothetical protein